MLNIMYENLIIGGIPIRIIKKKNLKNLYIRINPPEGEVTVSAPEGYSNDDIMLFVTRRLPEIIKVRNKMNSQKRQSKREYVSGESHYLWGKPYRLQVIYGGTKYTIEKQMNKIIFNVPDASTIDSRRKAFNEWYRKELRRVLEVVAKESQIKTNIFANEFKIKNMKTKWGTCNIDKRRIWINLQLVKKPIECLEYIIIHELVHLVEENHTNKFFSLVEAFYPGWKESKKLLSDLPLDYIEAGGEDDA